MTSPRFALATNLRAGCFCLTLLVAAPAWTQTTNFSSPAIVAEVQEFLFNLNYDIDSKGKLGPKTRKSIATYRQKVSLPAGEKIDEQVLAALRRTAGIQRKWGAIAIATDGAWQGISNQSDRDTATREAERGCARLKRRTSKCIVVTGAGDQWIAAIYCKQGDLSP